MVWIQYVRSKNFDFFFNYVHDHVTRESMISIRSNLHDLRWSTGTWIITGRFLMLTMVSPGESLSTQPDLSTRDHSWDDNVLTCVTNDWLLSFFETILRIFGCFVVFCVLVVFCSLFWFYEFFVSCVVLLVLWFLFYSLSFFDTTDFALCRSPVLWIFTPHSSSILQIFLCIIILRTCRFRSCEFLLCVVLCFCGILLGSVLRSWGIFTLCRVSFLWNLCSVSRFVLWNFVLCRVSVLWHFFVLCHTSMMQNLVGLHRVSILWNFYSVSF